MLRTLINNKEYEIHETLAELKASAKVDFDCAVKDINVWMTNVDNMNTSFSMYIYLISKALSKVGIDLFDLLILDISHLINKDGSAKEGVLDDHLNKLKLAPEIKKSKLRTKYMLEQNSCVLTLYEFYYEMIYLYVPTPVDDSSFSYMYKGEKYTITNNKDEAISVLQGVEALQNKFIIEEAKSNKSYNIEDLITTELITTLAILSKKEGEDISEVVTDLQKYKDYIKKKKEHLVDIDAKTALDVTFFLMITI